MIYSMLNKKVVEEHPMFAKIKDSVPHIWILKVLDLLKISRFNKFS